MSSDEELAKDLGPLAALTIGIGTMIGAGIFVLPDTAIERAGSLAGLAFVIGGIVALLTAFAVAELGTAMPRSGGMYFYVNHALGPLFGSIAGWGNWLGLAFASAFYMIGFGEYVSVFAPSLALDLGVLAFSSAQVWGLLGGTLFVAVNYVGAKETGRLQNVIVIVLLAILGGFAVMGVLDADTSLLFPIEQEWWGELMPVTAIVFVSYLGFGQIASVGEEIQNPGRNLPLAIVGSVVIVTVLYGLLMVVMLAVVSVDRVEGADQPAAIEAAEAMLSAYDLTIPALGTIELAGVAGGIILFGALLATASSANASILASSRINFAMGRDRIVTAELNEIHERFATPYRSIALTGGLILLFIAAGTVEVLATLGSVLHLLIFALVNVGLIVMRTADPPEYEPAFRVPGYPVTPVVAAVLSLGLIWFMSPTVIALTVGFVAFAVAWYLGYARTRATKRGVLGQWIEQRSAELPDAAVEAAETVRPEGDETVSSGADEYRVFVPLSNPRTETDLISIASAIARHRGGTVDAAHVVQVPDQTSLQYGADHVDDLSAESEKLLARAEADAETFGIDVETHTILSHRAFEELFDAARRHEADLVVMGWSPEHPGRAESRLDELTAELPCDFLALRDREFDPSHVLLPTAGGPDSDLSADVARVFQAEFDAEVSLLHALAADESEAEGEAFLEQWARDRGLEGARRVVSPWSPRRAIVDEAADHTVLLMGATERGLLSRIVGDDLHTDVVDQVECSVLLAERPTTRSLRERLLGRK